MSMEKICQGLCKAHGTGQCAPLCLSNSSIHTTGGMCPERTKVWRRSGTEIAYALGHGDWIDPVVRLDGMTFTLTPFELMQRSLLNPRDRSLIAVELFMAARDPKVLFNLTQAQEDMLRAKARRLLGRE